MFLTQYLIWTIIAGSSPLVHCSPMCYLYYSRHWLILKFYFNSGSLMQTLIAVLCSGSARGLVRERDLFACKREGPTLCFCIFDRAFLWSTSVLWHQLACVTLSMSTATLAPSSEFNYFHSSMNVEDTVVICSTHLIEHPLCSVNIHLLRRPEDIKVSNGKGFYPYRAYDSIFF